MTYFSMAQSIVCWRGYSKRVIWTTSTVVKVLTWNLKHIFGTKCRCAWHIFMWTSLLFLEGLRVIKILLTLTTSIVVMIVTILNISFAWSVDVHCSHLAQSITCGWQGSYNSCNMNTVFKILTGNIHKRYIKCRLFEHNFHVAQSIICRIKQMSTSIVFKTWHCQRIFTFKTV